MIKIIKKYQKKLLAIFAVLLMIAFVATLGPGGGNTRGQHKDVVVGQVNGQNLYERELQAGKDQWQTLMRIPVVMRQSFGQEMPLPYAMLPFPVVQDIQKHPELFVLIQKEAASQGITVSPDEARTLLVNQLNRPFETISTQEVEAIQGMLAIAGEYQQVASAVKVSQPMWRREAAQQFQGVRLNLVDYRVDDFEKNVPAPTAEQLTAQFEKYKNTAPRVAESMGAESIGADTLGFGYQIPARVKVQYFEIPHAEVMASLQPTPESRHEWEVKAADYYLSHQEEFRNPTTAPASQPASTQVAASQPAASQPAIKPFDQVKAQIVEKLMTTDVAKQTALIEKELTSKLATDWIAIRKAVPAATQPATTQSTVGQTAATQAATQTVATSQPVVPEMNLTRLEQIRTDIQLAMHVSVTIRELNDWQDSKQLGALPGIGTAQSSDRDSFSEYALNFTGQGGLMRPVSLQVWEPSQPLTDLAQNAYVFRLTAAEAAHAPAEMTPVLVQVAKDWRTAQAYDLAKQAATKLADSAKALGLAQASRTAGLTMLATGQFSPRNPRNIIGYPLTDATAQQDLGQAARKLLEQATVADPHPSILFELPTVQRVGVAELAAAQLELPEAYVQLEIINSQRQSSMVELATDWFAYDAVVQRVNYKVEKS